MNDSFDHCYIKKSYFFVFLSIIKQFLLWGNSSNVAEGNTRDKYHRGTVVSRSRERRARGRMPACLLDHPPPYSSSTVEFVGAEQREIYRRTEPFSDAIHRVQVGRTWQSRELIGLAFKPWARFPFRISLPPPFPPLHNLSFFSLLSFHTFIYISVCQLIYLHIYLFIIWFLFLSLLIYLKYTCIALIFYSLFFFLFLSMCFFFWFDFLLWLHLFFYIIYLNMQNN